MASCKTTVCCKTHAWLDEQQERVCLAGTRPWVSALQNPNQQQQQKSHVLSHPAVALLQQGFQVSRLNPFCLIWYLLTLFPLFSICKWVLLIYFWQFHTCARCTMVMHISPCHPPISRLLPLMTPFFPTSLLSFLCPSWGGYRSVVPAAVCSCCGHVRASRQHFTSLPRSPSTALTVVPFSLPYVP